MDADPDRPVGEESRKTYAEKIANGFFDKYLSGSAIVELGYKGGLDAATIVPQAVGIDLDYPGYDGIHLPFPDSSQDAVYSSHCLEHIEDYRTAFREWYRVLKVGGYMVIIVPHQHLFERRQNLPSIWNWDHRRFYTPASFLAQIEEVFEPNSYRIRYFRDNDLGFDYSKTPFEPPVGCFEIELVLQKLATPVWQLEDGTSRHYPAPEFTHCLPDTQRWWLETDFSITDRCIIWGPYLPLPAGDYKITYFFEAIDLEDQHLASPITVDIAGGMTRIQASALSGEEGAAVLRRGNFTVDFSAERPIANVEFRLFTQGVPYTGKLRFHGVAVRRLWLRRPTTVPAG